MEKGEAMRDVQIKVRVPVADLAAALAEALQAEAPTMLKPMPLEEEAPRPRAPRAPRGSKVGELIKKALVGAPRTSSQLRDVLKDAGFSPSSLSTTLSILQKSGEVERSVDGTYAFAKAAE
jgi:hypothetical protein